MPNTVLAVKAVWREADCETVPVLRRSSVVGRLINTKLIDNVVSATRKVCKCGDGEGT